MRYREGWEKAIGDFKDTVFTFRRSILRFFAKLVV